MLAKMPHMKRAEKMHDSLTRGECSNGTISFSGREDYDHTATLLLIARRATKRVTKKTTVVISALRFLNVPVTAQLLRKSSGKRLAVRKGIDSRGGLAFACLVVAVRARRMVDGI